MGDLFLYRDDDDGIILFYVREGVIETIFDSDILAYHTKIVPKNDFHPLAYSGPPIMSLEINGMDVVDFRNDSPTRFPILGTGIRGVISTSPLAKSILSPLILPTILHVKLFEKVSRKTLIYVETNGGLESVIYGWSCLYNIIKQSNNHKLLTPITHDKIRMLREMWWNLHRDYSAIVSPINIILKLLKCDSIVDLTTQTGIIMSEQNSTGLFRNLDK